MAWLVDLLKVKRLAPITLPDLADEWLAQVEKGGLEIVVVDICVIWMEIILCDPVYTSRQREPKGNFWTHRR